MSLIKLFLAVVAGLVLTTASRAAQNGLGADPTAGISYEHVGDDCSWSGGGPLRRDTVLKKVPVEGKENEWTEKRVRYVRVRAGSCWSTWGSKACPCSFENLEEVEDWYIRTVKTVTYTYVTETDIETSVVGVDKLPAAKKILDGLMRGGRTALKIIGTKTGTKTVYGPWTPLEPVHNFKDICLCDGETEKPGDVPSTGIVPGSKHPSTGRPKGPTTGGPMTPPPFAPRTPNTVGGDDIPVPGSGPTTGGFPSVDPKDLPKPPICKASNDVPLGRFRWSYKRESEWETTLTPAYIAFSGPPECLALTKQDRYKWIKKITMTGTLKGEASCSPKSSEEHASHGECAAGCDLESYPNKYTITWFRTLTFEQIDGDLKCVAGLPEPWDDFGSITTTMSGIVGWKPVFGDWEVVIGGGTSGSAASCNCSGENEHEHLDDEHVYDD